VGNLLFHDWVRFLSFHALLSKIAFLFLLSPSAQAAFGPVKSQFPACETNNVELVREEDWKTPRAGTAFYPDKVGNFGSVNEGLRYLKGDSRDFLLLLRNSILVLSKAQSDYAQELSQCLKKPNSCREESKIALEKDRSAIGENWKKMRLGLALGFPSFGCMGMCYSYEPVIVPLFQWGTPFLPPSQMGEAPISPERDTPGALSLTEAKEADALVRTITGSILDRKNTFWDYLASATNPGTFAGPDGVKLRQAAMALNKKGPNGEPSFRDRWKNEYFEALQSAPLLLFVSNPNPSNKDLEKAYTTIQKNAQEIIKGLKSEHRLRPWEYFSLTARDILMTYHGVIDAILRDPENQKFCGIAERMLREKTSNEGTKFAVAIGSTIATGVGCILTGSSYIGLSICTLGSLAITSKATLDARAEADQARRRAGSSATPTLMVDEYENLSNIDQVAVTAEALKYFSLIDVAALGGMATKMTIKGFTFLKRLEEFSKEISMAQNASPAAARTALRVVLAESPQLTHAKRGSEILAALPKGILTETNALEIGKIARSLGVMTSKADTQKWTKLIASASENGKDSLTGLSLLLEKTLQGFLIDSPDYAKMLTQTLQKEVGQFMIIGGRFVAPAQRQRISYELFECLVKIHNGCESQFAVVGKQLLQESDLSLLDKGVLQNLSRQALGRNISDDEALALFESRKIGSLDAYTAQEVVQQNKLLTKAGLSEADISILRKKGVIGNWVRDASTPTPSQTYLIQSPARLDREILEKVKKGKTLNYFVDDLDQMQITEEALDFSGQSVLFWKMPTPSGQAQAVRVQEAGKLVFDSGKRRLEFQPQYGGTIRPSSEGNTWVKQLANSKLEFENGSVLTTMVKANPKLDQVKTLQCLDVLQARQKGKGFVLNSVIGDNIVMTGAIMSGELTGAGRLNSKHGREIIMTDYLASNISWILNGYLRRTLSLRNIDFLSYASTRIPSNFLLIEVQREIFTASLTDDGERRATNIRNYNAGWMFAKLPMSYYFDRYLVNTLPLQLYGACSGGAKAMKVVFHPGMVAIYEKTFSAFMYFQGRKAIAGE